MQAHQAALGGAFRMTYLQRPDLLSFRDSFADRDIWPYGFVGRAQSRRMLDGDDVAVDELARERDYTVRGRVHTCALRSG